MTTIAYRDGILAVDRQMSHGHYVRATDMKLHLIKSSYSIDYAFAFAGTITMGLAFVEWVKEGMVKGEFPIADVDKKAAFHSLLVQRVAGSQSPPVRYFGNDLIGMSEDEVPYTAQGAGDEFALGAMYHGASAVEAVRAANRMCAWSGYGVQYVDVVDFEIKRYIAKS